MKAKTNENKNKHSARKKLIPAVAMLTTSAIMLSTATYAWFTMNKEVEMTGLNMTATTAGALEISLGGVDSSGTIAADLKEQPGDTTDETSWTSAIKAAEYYNSIDLVKPSSSVDAKTFYDATDASNAGMTAKNFKDVTATGRVTTTPRTTIDKSADSITSGAGSNYYVEIPVHLRTSNVSNSDSKTSSKIYYKMAIDNNKTGGSTDELYKAVRVALVPSSGNAKILGADNTYYEGGPVSSVAAGTGEAGGLGTKAAGASSVTTDGVFPSVTDSNYQSSTGVDSGLTINYATSEDPYGHLDFTLCIWLEGESKYCYNKNAGQEWNISLAFAMENEEGTAGNFETT